MFILKWILKYDMFNVREYNNELYLFWKEYNILQFLVLREYNNIVISYGNTVLLCLDLREYNNIAIS